MPRLVHATTATDIGPLGARPNFSLSSQCTNATTAATDICPLGVQFLTFGTIAPT